MTEIEIVEPRATHREIAELLNVATATVSRLRSGGRNPSYRLMTVIAERMDWPISDQVTARSKDNWHLGFETACRKTVGGRG